MVDEAFIRSAVDQAELNVLRMALFQATGDPEVGAIPLEYQTVRGGAGTLAVVPEGYRDRLKDLAVRYLLDGAADHVLRVPTDDEIDSLILMAEGKAVSAGDLALPAGIRGRRARHEWGR